MNELFSNAAEIIAAASSSKLGIIALAVLVFGALSFAYFKDSPTAHKAAVLGAIFLGTLLYGVAVFGSFESYTRAASLGRATTALIEVYPGRSQSQIQGPGQLPTSVSAAASEFEFSWKRAGLEERMSIEEDDAFKALTAIIEIERRNEERSFEKKQTLYWVDQAIQSFEERDDEERLIDLMSLKAMVYFDILQMEHNNKSTFDRLAKEGEAVVAAMLASDSGSRRADVLRTASRFYYARARPESFRLHEQWNSNYLNQAYETAKQAIDPRSVTQYTRTVIRLAKQRENVTDERWTTELRQAQRLQVSSWKHSRQSLPDSTSRLSRANVAAVSTLEAVSREWILASPNRRLEVAEEYVRELDEDAIAPLRECVALVSASPLQRSYLFDMHYDLARVHAVKTQMYAIVQPSKEQGEFELVRSELEAARDAASSSQLISMKKTLAEDPVFSRLGRPRVSLLLESSDR